MRGKTDRLNEILRLGTELNTMQDVDMLLERVLSEARKVVNADAGSIYTCNGNRLIFNYSQNDTLEKKLSPGQKLPFHYSEVQINTKSISGCVASTGEILNIPDVYKIKPGSSFQHDPSYDRKFKYITKSVLTVPMKDNRGKIIGVLQMINAKNKNRNTVAFSKTDEPFVLHFANTASIVLQRAQMTRALLLRMISMAELRDPKETGQHVNRVASYSVELYEKWAIRRKMNKEEIIRNKDIIRMAAMLHDVGKVAISDLILKKPAQLTNDEYEIMKSHSQKGARLLGDIQSDFDEIAATIALTHHENWDGTGYPGHIDINTGIPLKTGSTGKALPLKGEEIPIYGRLVALADVYDALCSKRVYKDAWQHEDVLKEIKNLSGKKFDPELVDVFFESVDLIESIRIRYPEG